MSKDDFDKAMAKERLENQQNIDKVLASLGNVTKSLGDLSSQLQTFTVETTKTHAEVKNDISTLTTQMGTLQSSVDDTRVKFESKIVELEGSIKNLQKDVVEANTISADNIKEAVLPIIEEQILPKVKDDLKKEILAPVESAWNAIQSQTVNEHEPKFLRNQK